MSHVKITEVLRLVRVAHAADKPLLLEGPHGIGKSEVFESAAESMDMACVVLDLSLMEPVDLLGLPRIEAGRTVYAPPAILPREGRGLLLLEELNRAEPATRTPALELLTRRRLHQYELPPGWLPCASINPAGEDYAVDPLDPALLSRFITVQVEADHRGWIRWARDNDLHPSVVAYAEAAPDIFSGSDANPRSMKYASDFLLACEDSGLAAGGSELLLAGLAGLVGDTLAVAMVRFFMDTHQPLEPEAILAEYPSVRPQVARSVQEGRLDSVRSSLLKLQRHLQRHATWDGVQGDERRRENLCTFLSDLPPDLHEAFKAWAVARGYEQVAA